jgi:hypothetical protein
MKHTGWRKPTPGLGVAEQLAQAGERVAVPKSTAFVAIKRVGAHIGLKAGDLLLLDTLGAFTQTQDWEEGRRPIVWASNAYLMEQTGFSLSALKRHARRLVEAGVISFKDSPNGKRWGRRDEEGVIIEAYGFDLSPLSARAEEFEQLHMEIQAERALCQRLKRQITVSRRMIRARICTSDVHGEKRFTSTIARRLDQLGALTKGQRETGSQGMFREEDNLESPIARGALRGYYADLAAGRAGAMSYERFTDWTALRLIDHDGVLLEELPPIQRFLNRVLALPIHMQNALFAEFMSRIADQTERARAAGTLDLGVETLRGERIEQVSAEDLWTCPRSGAVTRIIGLEVTDPVHILSAEEALDRNPDKLTMINRASGRAALISSRPMQMYDEEIVTLMRKVIRPSGSTYVEEGKFRASAWEEIERPEFLRLWDVEADSLPKVTTTKLYLLTGLLLPIWKDIPSGNERIYRVTPEGHTFLYATMSPLCRMTPISIPSTSQIFAVLSLKSDTAHSNLSGIIAPPSVAQSCFKLVRLPYYKSGFRIVNK